MLLHSTTWLNNAPAAASVGTSTSVSGLTVWMHSSGCSARTTTDANSPPAKETTNDRLRHPRRLWRADRAHYAEDPAPPARPDRTRLGVSHGERPAPPVAGGGQNGDEGRRALRAGLAQRRAHQPTRPAAARLWRRASHAEPHH